MKDKPIWHSPSTPPRIATGLFLELTDKSEEPDERYPIYGLGYYDASKDAYHIVCTFPEVNVCISRQWIDRWAYCRSISNL